MNINEIAKLAGVSRATISRYFNNGYVSDEKRKQIEEVVAKTGYKPSTQAQTLRTKKSKVIGVIIPKINSESISRMVEGISTILSKAGYQMLLTTTANNEEKELEYIRMLRDYNADGIILMGTIITKEHKRLLSQLDVPVVILGQKVNGFSCVYQNDYDAARDLAMEVLKKAKRVGYIGVTNKDQAVGVDRQKGVLDACSALGLPESTILIAKAQFSIDSGYEKTKWLFEKNESLDTVFCATDNIALGALSYLRERGKKIPEEVQLIGMGDTKMASLTAPTLTTVHFFYKTSGMEAARLLLEMLEEDNRIAKEIKMGYTVRVQNSTK